MTTFLFLWIFFALIVGFISSARTLGFWGGFFLSLIVSPLIAFIIALITKSKYQRDLENRAYQNMAATSPPARATSQQSISDELEKLKRQFDEGVITQEQFQQLKNKLIAKFD